MKRLPCLLHKVVKKLRHKDHRKNTRKPSIFFHESWKVVMKISTIHGKFVNEL